MSENPLRSDFIVLLETPEERRRNTLILLPNEYYAAEEAAEAEAREVEALNNAFANLYAEAEAYERMEPVRPEQKGELNGK